MGLSDLRAICFPYCLERQDDNTWVVLNRNYKPIGFNTLDWIEYEDYPIKQRIVLTPELVTKLSVDENPENKRIYLYTDATNPIVSSKNMESYIERLCILFEIPCGIS